MCGVCCELSTICQILFRGRIVQNIQEINVSQNTDTRDKDRKGEQKHQLVGSDSPHQLVRPDPPHQLVGPDPPHQLVGPDSPHQLVGPDSPHQLVRPDPTTLTGEARFTTPTGGARPTTPTSGGQIHHTNQWGPDPPHRLEEKREACRRTKACTQQRVSV